MYSYIRARHNEVRVKYSKVKVWIILSKVDLY